MGELIRLQDNEEFRERVLANIESRIVRSIEKYSGHVFTKAVAREIVIGTADELIGVFPHLADCRTYVAQQVSAALMLRVRLTEARR